MKITDYEVIHKVFANELAYEVNLRIADGWQPFGPVAVSGPAGEESFNQAIVKYEKEPNWSVPREELTNLVSWVSTAESEEKMAADIEEFLGTRFHIKVF